MSKSLFERRHYNALAAWVAYAPDFSESERRKVAHSLAKELEKISPGFKYDIFIKACKLEAEE